MTTPHTQKLAALLSLHLCHRASIDVRNKDALSPHIITVLIAAYLYNNIVSNRFTISAMKLFIHSFRHKRIEGYINRLCEIGYLKLISDNSKFRHYIITQPGVEAVNSIIEKYNDLVYVFCNKYGIEL